MAPLIVIPARWGSKRFPGKPLAQMGAMTLLHRTITVAREAANGIDGAQVVVATDDGRIARHATEIGCDAVLTDPAIGSGTERVLAAVQTFSSPPAAVINLQGDCPFVLPGTLRALMVAVLTGASVATPVVKLSWEELSDLRQQKIASPFSGTTCICDKAGRARWFSKQIIPAIRNEDRLRKDTAISPVLRHVGIYAYTMASLTKFASFPATEYERLEGLEQLRFLEMELDISVVSVASHRISMGGIDTPADLERAKTLIQRFGDPHAR